MLQVKMSCFFRHCLSADKCKQQNKLSATNIASSAERGRLSQERIHTYLPGCHRRGTGHDCLAKLLQDVVWKFFVRLQQLLTLNLSQKQKQSWVFRVAF